MKLLHPIVPRDGKDCVRVLVVTRNYHRRTLYRSGESARSYLAAVCEAQLRCTICDSAAAYDTLALSLPSALQRIQAGDVDLVIASDLSSVARAETQLLNFLLYCQDYRVRFIAFENHLDTADADAGARINAYIADISTEEEILGS